MRKKFVIVLILMFAFSLPVYALEYSLTELLQSAESNAGVIKKQIREIQNLIDEIKIIKAGYHPKLSLDTKPITISPDLMTENQELSLNANGSINASWKLPFGLSLSAATNFVNISDAANRDMTYSFSAKYQLYPGRAYDQANQQIKTREHNLTKAQWTLSQKQLEVHIQTWQKFYSTLILQERLQLANAALNEAENDLNISTSLRERGTISEQEYLEKKIFYNTNQINCERVKQQYLNCLADLLTYAGISGLNFAELGTVVLTGSITELASLNLLNPEELPAFDVLMTAAEKNSITLEISKINLKMANEEMNLLYNRPEVTTQFDYRLIPLTKKEEYNWAFTVNANYQLFDGGVKQLERQKQKDSITDLQFTVAETELAVLEGLQNRLTDVKLAYMEYQNTLLDLQKSKLEAEIKTQQFESGLCTKAQLESAERGVVAKKLDSFQKKIDYQVAFWSLTQYTYLALELKEAGK